MRFYKEEILAGDISFSSEVPYITQGGGGKIIAPTSQFDDVRDKVIQPVFGNDGVDGGNGSNLPPIIVKDPRYLGTENADFQASFFIKSNVNNAAIFVAGENTYKVTPENLKVYASDILKAKGKYVITLVKDGYTTREQYQINVVSNRKPIDELVKPSFDYSINGYDSYLYRNDVIARDRIVRPEMVYTDVPRYIFSITKVTKDGESIFEPADPLNAELEFTLDVSNKNSDDTNNYYSISITTQNPEAVKISYSTLSPIDGGIVTEAAITQPITRLTGNRREFLNTEQANDTPRRRGLLGRILNRNRDTRDTSARESIFRRRRPINIENSDLNIVPTDSGLRRQRVTNVPSLDFIKLTPGQNVVTIPIGANLYIESADVNSYRVTNILINGENKDYEPLVAEPGKSVSTNFLVESNLTISITTESIPEEVVDINEISLVNSETTRKYNKNSQEPVTIGLYVTGALSSLKIYVNKKEFTFSEFQTVDTAGGTERKSILVAIPASAFDSVGNYKVILVPYFSRTNVGAIGVIRPLQGEKLELVYQVVTETLVTIPDIFDITYPKEITPADYVGTDVNFNISYKSRDTQYAKLFYGDAFQQISAQGTIQLNVKSVLEKLGNKVIEDDDFITFSVKLVPYTVNDNEVIAGKEELITIKFRKGKLLIPRAVALSRISEGFEALFNQTQMEDESSKYLTHLLHLGDGNNRIITTWTGSRDSLIVKLYEPIGTDIQPNDLVWISKPQSNPIIETVTLVSNIEKSCINIKGPNFSLEPDNGIGWSAFNELMASGSQTSTSLINKIASGSLIDTKKLEIQYVSGSEFIFENFVNYSSAEERANNFYYKVQMIEYYQSRYDNIISSSASGSATVYVEANNYIDSINQIVNNFDGFENFLYTDTEYDTILSYPKNTNGSLKPSTGIDAVAWINSLVNLSANYDKNNPNYLINNIPEFIKEDYNNEEFFVFLNMLGQHFDILWSYINAVGKNKILTHKKQIGIIDEMVFHMLESLGWNAKKAYDSKFLWEYAFGLNKDGTQKYGMSLLDANQEVWRRILNNLPYLLKNKGTSRAMKAIMACYGVPQSLLTIMEFGGPQDPTKGGTTQFTFDDRTAAITLDDTSAIKVPWHSYSTEGYPNCIEFRIKPSLIPNTSYTLVSGSEWSLDLIQTTGSFGKLELNFGGDQALSTYFETSGLNYPYINTSIEYVYGPDYKTGSLDFPISTEYYSNVAINRYNTAGTGSWYEVWLSTTNGDRIITSVSMSLFCIDSQWETGSTLQIGGNGYEGNVDEFRLWRVPLQKSKFNNHTLFPDSINGNSYTASTSDLIFRLDFEYPKDRTLDNAIKNVAINTTYGENYATASNFYSASSYPYQYEPYERTVTANVPSTGYSFGNKIRFEDIEIQTGKQLSHKVRATQKSFDRAPIDSNRLGLFFSPIKELNMDILKAFGDFNIDNYIGDPRDEYKDTYRELENLREYYFERLDRNIYEYIQLVRYINKSLFDVLQDLAPARAKISKGLLIEPHFLERSKHAWKPVESIKLDYQSSIDVAENNKILSSYEVKNAEFNAIEDIIFDNTYDTYETIITDIEPELVADNPTYDAEILPINENFIETEYPTYPPTGSINIDCKFGATLIGQADSFKLVQIGMDKDSLSNAGFGLYGKNGVAKVWDNDTIGNLTSDRQNVYVVKESYQERVAIQTEGWPATNIPGQQIKYGYQYLTKYRYKISKLPLGSPTLTATGAVVEVKKLNGYLPSHYKFVNNLSEGMQRSYFKGSKQDATTTPDGLDPVEIFTTNPNILRVADTGRGSGEPILIVT